MLRIFKSQVSKIEEHLKAHPNTGRRECLIMLRKIGLTGFGELMFSLPNSEFPSISAVMPRMASDDVQKNWTGNFGDTLLKQSLDFANYASFAYTSATSKTLRSSRILDFGCGYGRFARLFYYYTDEENFFSVDPWNKSIQICQDCGLSTNFFLSDYLPESLPLENVRFDFIFAFSVFTHLSRNATLICLRTLHKYLNDEGVLLITIRPVEFWRASNTHISQKLNEQMIANLEREHFGNGFAFLQSGGANDPTSSYGDTSFTIEWLEHNLSIYKVLQVDRSLTDGMQLYITLQKR